MNFNFLTTSNNGLYSASVVDMTTLLIPSLLHELDSVKTQILCNAVPNVWFYSSTYHANKGQQADTSMSSSDN